MQIVVDVVARRFVEHLRRFRAAYVALLLSSIMTGASAFVLRRSLLTQERLWLNALAYEVSDRAKSRAEPYLGFLRGVRGLYVGSMTVEPEEFGEFVMVVRPQLPALEAAIYAPWTDHTARIVYAEPTQWVAELVGMDLMADPVTRPALDRARRGSDPIASTGTSFWMFVYIPPAEQPEPDMVPGAHRPGVAGVRVRADLLWSQLILGPNRHHVAYQLRGVAAIGSLPFYEEGHIDRLGRTIETTIPLTIAGGMWTLRIVAARNIADAIWWIPWLLLGLGAVASGLLFALMRVQILARESAEHLTALRDEFLSAAAHELKTPVTAIKGFAQLLRAWDLEQVMRRGDAALASIERQANRIDRLVQEMLEASRLQRRRLTLAREYIDMGEAVREITDDTCRSFPDHQVTITSEGATTVFADRNRIAQVVSNLLANAAKFSPGGGAICVDTRQVGDEVVTSVQDFGIGIASDRQYEIFERYYQAHRGTKFEGLGGLGLGLYVTKELVTRHGGRIWFESTPGQGTTFHFSLPLAKETT